MYGFNRNLPHIEYPPKIFSSDGSEIDHVKCYNLQILLILLTKVKTRIGFLYHNKSSFIHSSKQLLVKMTVLPILDYGDVVYRSASKTLLHKLDVIYHTAIRFVTGASFNTHHCHLYSLLNWPSLHSRRQIHWFLFIYKSLIGKTVIFTVTS